MKSNKHSETSKGADRSANNRKVVISTPTATVTSAEKAAATSLPDAAQAAAAVGEKKEERTKRSISASKSSILPNKKKKSNVLTMWKQRTQEGQAAPVDLDQGHKEDSSSASGISTSLPAYELAVRPKHVRNSSGGSLMGVIRSSGRAVGRSEAWNLGHSGGAAETSFAYHQSFLRVAAQVQLFLIIRINILQVAGIGLLRGVYMVQLLQWMNLTWNM
ncbi:hypothetical protein SAY87_000232 [Trapa incisa]|uniref:Uncharacterized protein n=1 Tax=Trapa incisa TaxID=236973 RepID=A0AAN7GEZ9_9MYRT|nr:hypothetical protein SAY87_000232 [Trapa incisa]